MVHPTAGVISQTLVVGFKQFPPIISAPMELSKKVTGVFIHTGEAGEIVKDGVTGVEI